MSRMNRRSFFLSSGSTGDHENVSECIKQMQRLYDSTIVHSGIYEDEEIIHACAVGISGIIVNKPVTEVRTGDKVKGKVDPVLSTLLHAFCAGKIFLIKLMLPHHPAARDELGPRYDQIGQAAYVKTAEFLAKILGNVNYQDSKKKTPLDSLLSMMSQSNICVSAWVPVLSYMIGAGARSGTAETNNESSALTMLRRLSSHGFGKKTCGDDCEREMVKFISNLAEEEGLEKNTLQDIFQKENEFISEIIQKLN